MEDLEVLMSDEFANLARSVQLSMQDKKALEEEFAQYKKSYEERMAAILQTMRNARDYFVKWKKERALNVGDG